MMLLKRFITVKKGKTMFNFLYALIGVGCLMFAAFIICMIILTGEEPWFIWILALTLSAFGVYAVGSTLHADD
jgi:uncharacterized membrane protein